MKKIKFRVWDNKEKSMLYLQEKKGYNVPLFTDNNLYISLGIVFFRDIYEKILCIGIKDKNGKEIYVGDIFKENNILFMVGFGEFTIIEDNMKMIGFYIEAFKEEKIKFLDKEMTMKLPLFEDACKEIEVIGNKWENPEL